MLGMELLAFIALTVVRIVVPLLVILLLGSALQRLELALYS